MSALDKQVGGKHYNELGMQPLELTYLNFGYEGLKAAVYCKVNKYMLRDKGDHLENIEKAIHCLEIQRDMYKLKEQLPEKNQFDWVRVINT